MPSAGDKRIVFKASCTAQEKPNGASRFYLDSDVGEKLAGSATIDLTSKNITYVSSKEITTTETMLAETYDFFFVKCISGDYITIELDGTNEIARCYAGEAFATKLLSVSRTIKINTSGTSTIEYLTGI